MCDPELVLPYSPTSLKAFKILWITVHLFMIVVFFPILKCAKKQAPPEDQRPVWSVFFLIVQGLNVKSAYVCCERISNRFVR